MLQLSFDFLSENSKKVVEDCRMFYLNQVEVFFKVYIYQNNDPLQWQILQNLRWRRSWEEKSLLPVLMS